MPSHCREEEHAFFPSVCSGKKKARHLLVWPAMGTVFPALFGFLGWGALDMTFPCVWGRQAPPPQIPPLPSHSLYPHHDNLNSTLKTF